MVVASLAGPTGRWVVSTSSGLSGRLRHTRLASASDAPSAPWTSSRTTSSGRSAAAVPRTWTTARCSAIRARSGSRAGAGGTSPAPASSGTRSTSQAAVAGWTRFDTFVVRTSEPRTCCQSQYGGAASAAQARPHATIHPCSEASAAACSAGAVLPIPGSPTRCTTRALPRRAAVIAVAIAVSSRARPTSTSDGACGATPGTLPDRSATTRSPWTVGRRPGGMSTSPGGGPHKRGGKPGSRSHTGFDVADDGALAGVLDRGHEQFEAVEGVRSRSRPDAPPFICAVLALRPLSGQAYQRGEHHGTNQCVVGTTGSGAHDRTTGTRPHHQPSPYFQRVPSSGADRAVGAIDIQPSRRTHT